MTHIKQEKKICECRTVKKIGERVVSRAHPGSVLFSVGPVADRHHQRNLSLGKGDKDGEGAVGVDPDLLVRDLAWVGDSEDARRRKSAFSELLPRVVGSLAQ